MPILKPILIYLIFFYPSLFCVFSKYADIHGCHWYLQRLLSVLDQTQHWFSTFCGASISIAQTQLLDSRKRQEGRCYGFHCSFFDRTCQWGSTELDWWLLYSTPFEEIVSLSTHFAFWGIFLSNHLMFFFLSAFAHLVDSLWQRLSLLRLWMIFGCGSSLLCIFICTILFRRVITKQNQGFFFFW